MSHECKHEIKPFSAPPKCELCGWSWYSFKTSLGLYEAIAPNETIAKKWCMDAFDEDLRKKESDEAPIL